MAASLSSQLANLANPEPGFVDPEDDEQLLAGIESKLTECVDDDDDHNEISSVPSKLRASALSLLSESDRRYAGKVTSRAEIRDSDSGSDVVSDEEDEMNERARRLNAMLNAGENSSDVSEDKDEDDDEEDDDGDEESSDGESGEDSPKKRNTRDDDDIAEFNKLFANQLKQSQATPDNEDDSEFDEEDEEENDEDEEDEDDEGQEEYEDDAEMEEESDIEEENEDLSAFATKFKTGVKPKLLDISTLSEKAEPTDTDAGESEVDAFSRTQHDEVVRGKAVHQQLALWDNLLEGRIRLQKVLSLVNRLPQPSHWSMFEEEGGAEFTSAAKRCRKRVHEMLESVVELQQAILTKSGQIESTQTNKPDDSEAADDKTDKKQGTKRKLSRSQCSAELAKRHIAYTTYRNEVVEKWSEKTRLATGKFNSKSFSAFDQSAVKQIQQICSDKARLLARTRVKRTTYRVLGKPEDVTVTPTIPADNEEPPLPTREVTKDIDPQIFDDDDFYHDLLRQLIQRKCSDTSDPQALSRHMVQIQRLRSKVKRNVDTSASKGRKLRYNIHPKMVSFMAPLDTTAWTDDSKDDLFKSLFGQRFTGTAEDKPPDTSTIRII